MPTGASTEVIFPSFFGRKLLFSEEREAGREPLRFVM